MAASCSVGKYAYHSCNIRYFGPSSLTPPPFHYPFVIPTSSPQGSAVEVPPHFNTWVRVCNRAPLPPKTHTSIIPSSRPRGSAADRRLRSSDLKILGVARPTGGFTCTAHRSRKWSGSGQRVVMTPHSVNFGRLGGTSSARISQPVTGCGEGQGG